MLEILKQYWEWSKSAIYFTVAIMIITAGLSLICGCGHNVYWEREITGIRMDIPLGDGTLGFAIGCDKSVRATVRGGASFETSSSNGGGLFSGSGGQSKITQFKSNMQLNEGNMVEVLTSTNVPESVKAILASNLEESAHAPYFPGSILQTKESTIHIGRAAIQSNAVEQIQSTDPQGFDKLVDTTGNVIGHNVVNNTVNSVKDIIGTNIVNNTLNTTGGVVHDVVNPLEGTVEQIDDAIADFSDVIKSCTSIVIWVLAGIIIILIISFVHSSRKSKKTKAKHIEVDTNPEDATADAMTTAQCEDELDAAFSDQPQKLEQVITPVVEQPTTQGPSKVKKFFQAIVEYTKVLIGWIKLIPPEYRKQIVNMIVDYCKRKKAERDEAKKLESEQKKK